MEEKITLNHKYGQGKTYRQQSVSERAAFYAFVGLVLMLLLSVLSGCDVTSLGGAAVDVPVINMSSCATATVFGPDSKQLAELGPGESSVLTFTERFYSSKRNSGFYLSARVVAATEGCRDEIGDIDDEYVSLSSGRSRTDRWRIRF